MAVIEVSRDLHTCGTDPDLTGRQSFKNFIRHGKQARQPDASPPSTSNAAASERAYREQQAAREQQARAQAEREAREQAAAQQAKAAQPVYDEAAARIVAEEREAKGKLPNYPGLERYKLVVKMGE